MLLKDVEGTDELSAGTGLPKAQSQRRDCEARVEGRGGRAERAVTGRARG